MRRAAGLAALAFLAAGRLAAAAPAAAPAPPPPTAPAAPAAPPPPATPAVPTAAPPPRFEIPRPRRVVLDNGMVVMLLEDHELPLVSVTALIRTGSRLDPPAKLGLGALAGELLRLGGIAEGVDRRLAPDGALAGDALDDLLEARAAEMEVAVADDSASASLSCLAEDFGALLPLFGALLRHPAFDAGKLSLARDLAKGRLQRENDDPDAVLARELARLVYGSDSPYGRTPTFATLDAIERADLVAWHAANLQPQGIVLGLVGDFRTAEALAAVRAAFADWPRGATRPPGGESFPYRRQPNPGLFAIDKGDMSQSEVAMGHLGVVRNDPDFFAIEVLDEVLSGSFASRLISHVRTEQGLAYEVDGRIGADWDHPGLAVLSLSTKTQTTAAGLAALLAEARDLTAKPPTDEEVARARRSILASFVFHADSPAKVLEQQLVFELFGYPLDRLERYRAGIEAVTTAAVRQAAARHLHPDQFTILVVGPAETRDRSLAPFGKVTVLPLPDVTGRQQP
ncbi:MAG TPA: pitrilysin family protein [Thermoanaerobaculia bacterium]|nr:pitrilysin family protein [Thermoanaerobaculia bacterium]